MEATDRLDPIMSGVGRERRSDKSDKNSSGCVPVRKRLGGSRMNSEIGLEILAASSPWAGRMASAVTWKTSRHISVRTARGKAYATVSKGPISNG
jgi:hypothetical protein